MLPSSSRQILTRGLARTSKHIRAQPSSRTSTAAPIAVASTTNGWNWDSFIDNCVTRATAVCGLGTAGVAINDYWERQRNLSALEQIASEVKAETIKKALNKIEGDPDFQNKSTEEKSRWVEEEVMPSQSDVWDEICRRMKETSGYAIPDSYFGCLFGTRGSAHDAMITNQGPDQTNAAFNTATSEVLQYVRTHLQQESLSRESYGLEEPPRVANTSATETTPAAPIPAAPANVVMEGRVRSKSVSGAGDSEAGSLLHRARFRSVGSENHTHRDTVGEISSEAIRETFRVRQGQHQRPQHQAAQGGAHSVFEENLFSLVTSAEVLLPLLLKVCTLGSLLTLVYVKTVSLLKMYMVVCLAVHLLSALSPKTPHISLWESAKGVYTTSRYVGAAYVIVSFAMKLITQAT